jgi:hypothetical protein
MLVTKCICHKGFSGYTNIVARSNICVSRQKTTSHFLPALTLDCYSNGT